jgi:hypothetical protein
LAFQREISKVSDSAARGISKSVYEGVRDERQKKENLIMNPQDEEHHHQHHHPPEQPETGQEHHGHSHPAAGSSSGENITEVVAVHPDGHGGTEIDVIGMGTDKSGDLKVEFVEIIDIEEFSKSNGGKPPKAKRYKIRVDKHYYEVDVSHMTGRQILELAKKLPPERWMLNQKHRHGKIEPIALDQVVDFTAPGVERFMTLPKDQTEGHESRRRLFVLPEEDTEALDAGGFDWETLTVRQPNGAVASWLLAHGFPLPEKLGGGTVSVAVSIPSTYPSGALDMAYMHPSIQRPDRRPIPNTGGTVPIDGKHWQQWSRHYTPSNPWKPGEYNCVTHLHLVRDWFDREAAR